jgi:hypothetical protein|tara:strand:+ start:225 stop:422 length:198 start_codon:yes stop_codon:yes gene_type:complete
MTHEQTLHHTEQIANAIQRHESEYSTWELSKAIKLPTPQTAGTMGQQRSYAIDRAQQLLTEYNKK